MALIGTIGIITLAAVVFAATITIGTPMEAPTESDTTNG
jgi:hypothetical protein